MSKTRVKAKPKKTSQAAGIAAAVDAELAGVAITKRAKGLRPAREELAALRRWEEVRRQELRQELLTSVPKKWWVDTSGRSTKELHRLADRFEMPVRGASIDLPALVQWLHEFIEKHRAAITAERKSQTQSSEADAYYRARRRRIELHNAKVAGEVVSTDEYFRLTDAICQLYRDASKQLNRRFGQEAFEIVEAAVERAKERERTYLAELRSRGITVNRGNNSYEEKDAEASQSVQSVPGNGR
ncbi:MAG: hypothetical protein ACYC6N_06545 [Pirellulaceae bacterium]